MNIRQQAMAVAQQWADGQEHQVKVKECRSQSAFPAYRVYVKLVGKARGKHVATLVVLG